MREIKFRAWCRDDKKMYKVVSFHNSVFGECEQEYVRVCELDADESSEIVKIQNLYNFELMQYTGEKDSSGKEIYEGDIVEFITERRHDGNEVYPKLFRSEVKFIDGGFIITESNELDTWLCAMTQGDNMIIEVIGNIFENEELLKEIIR